MRAAVRRDDLVANRRLHEMMAARHDHDVLPAAYFISRGRSIAARRQFCFPEFAAGRQIDAMEATIDGGAEVGATLGDRVERPGWGVGDREDLGGHRFRDGCGWIFSFRDRSHNDVAVGDNLVNGCWRLHGKTAS